jgi:hypothetical protein
MEVFKQIKPAKMRKKITGFLREIDEAVLMLSVVG